MPRGGADDEVGDEDAVVTGDIPWNTTDSWC